jgi:hypothetical protein
MFTRSHRNGILWFFLVAVSILAACHRGGSEPPAADEENLNQSSGDTQEATSEPEDALAPPQAVPVVPVAEPAAPTPTPRTPPAQVPAPEESSGQPAAPPAIAPRAPAPPPELEIIEVTVPSGTVLELELLTALDTSVNRVGDEIEGRTISPIYVNGESVLPRGSYLEGRVTAVQPSGKVKGKASIAFTFDRLSTRSGLKKIRTSFVEKEAASGKKKDAGIIGGATGVGALVGGIIGGKKGAAIGAAVGGAGGTGVVLSTKGEEIHLPVGTEINVRLDESLVLILN